MDIYMLLLIFAYAVFRHLVEKSSADQQRLSKCPESYGMQVTLMVGIPKTVVEAAAKAGKYMKTEIGVSFRSSERRYYLEPRDRTATTTHPGQGGSCCNLSDTSHYSCDKCL